MQKLTIAVPQQSSPFHGAEVTAKAGSGTAGVPDFPAGDLLSVWVEKAQAVHIPLAASSMDAAVLFI